MPVVPGFLFGGRCLPTVSETDKNTVERPGVPAVRLLPAQLSVQLADADVGIAAVIVADPVQFLLCVRIGMLAVNPVKHTVKVRGQSVSLALKEFELLCLLLENRGVVYTRDQLLNHIWGYAFDGESRTVDVHIRHLRQKLGECGTCIETVRGIGYRIGEDTP